MLDRAGTDRLNDLLVYTIPQVIPLPASGFSLTWFTRVYDGDIIQVTGDADLPSGLTVDLCLPPVPCFLTIVGNASTSNTIRRHTNSRIVCEATSGCTGLTMRHVAVACTSEASAAGPLQISGAGALATIEGATFSDCMSVADGGSILAYNGATVKVFRTTFQRSSSQGNGGALALLGVHANTHVAASTFVDCTSALSGGAMSVSHYFSYPSTPVLSAMKVENCTFEGNVASKGGAFDVSAGSSVTLQSSQFKDNTASLDGGALDVTKSSMAVLNTTFIGNTASGLGGGALSAGSSVTIRSSQFKDNTASKGGAFEVSAGSSVTIQSSQFKGNTASLEGGALDVTESSVAVLNTTFIGNTASGLGGGALHVGSSKGLNLTGNTFTENTAPNGGGGAVLWQSGTAVAFLWQSSTVREAVFLQAIGPTTLDRHVKELCGSQPNSNAAGYGPCVATPYHRLEVQGMPTRQTPGYAGVPLKLEVVKLDTYGQNMTIDSSSSLQVYSAVAGTKVNDNTVAFLGSIFSGFQGGRAVFSVGVKPTFVSFSAADGRTELQRPPYLYFKGTDLTTGAVMETDPQQVHLALQNKTVCAPGSVLSLDPGANADTFPRAGACKACRPGTYSLDALASPAGTGQDPDCFNCPAGGDCRAGGELVKFDKGNWTQVGGMHVLKNCPKGYKVVNTSSDSNGVFLHDSQTCQVCNKVR